MYKHFNKYKLDMTIKDITIDFVDEEEIKTSDQTSTLMYTAGVSVIVCLTYDNYNSHEQIGYGTFRCDTRGKAVLEAKRIALDSASQRCCRMFGDIQSGHAVLTKK